MEENFGVIFEGGCQLLESYFHGVVEEDRVAGSESSDTETPFEGGEAENLHQTLIGHGVDQNNVLYVVPYCEPHGLNGEDIADVEIWILFSLELIEIFFVLFQGHMFAGFESILLFNLRHFLLGFVVIYSKHLNLWEVRLLLLDEPFG